MKLYALAFGFMVLDYLTGVGKALYTHTFASHIMRQGLFHKVALVCVMALGVLLDYAQTLVDIGVAAPVGIAACVYIITMEAFSSVENICAMNPEIMPDTILKLFGGSVQRRKEGEHD